VLLRASACIVHRAHQHPAAFAPPQSSRPLPSRMHDSGYETLRVEPRPDDEGLESSAACFTGWLVGDTREGEGEDGTCDAAMSNKQQSQSSHIHPSQSSHIHHITINHTSITIITHPSHHNQPHIHHNHHTSIIPQSSHIHHISIIHHTSITITIHHITHPSHLNQPTHPSHLDQPHIHHNHHTSITPQSTTHPSHPQ